jgi:TrmH family RNA methyltransferase
MSLENIHIVLVNTTHPGNIGGVARAMKNMGLARLRLVRPRYFPDAEASARASGADDLLEHAQVFDSLDAALADIRLVIGTSARRRAVAWPSVDARRCGELLVQSAVDAPVALLFGRERDGLTNAQIERCRYLATVPTHGEYASLNLAAAVQVFAYEILMASAAGLAPAADAHQPATAGMIQGYLDHLQRVLEQVDFLDPQQPRHLMHKLARLYQRAAPSDEEINILRGTLTAIERETCR